MKREQTNLVRFIIEECLPPIIRDWPLLNRLFSGLSGIDLEQCRRLRQRIPTLTPEQLTQFYRDFPRIQEGTDNSQKCIDRILAALHGSSVCDVGCGTGYLLRRIRQRGGCDTLVGVDFSRHTEWADTERITFIEHDILKLPFDDGQFDTVISTHTLEHILDIAAAVNELRRICSHRLLIVVPRERESIWSFNPHFHYFPYEHSFLKHLLPLSNPWHIERVGRDFVYTETLTAADRSENPPGTRK